MTHCSHNHDHNHTHDHDHSADKWTKISAARELFTGMASNFTFFTWFFFDKLNAKDNNTERYSLISLIVLITLYFAGSSTYCHKQLDKSHQPDATVKTADTETGLISQHRKLTGLEKIVLFGDGCDHVIDSAVPLAAGAAATLYFLCNADPIESTYFNAVVAACVLFSAVGSYASVRNCYVAMKKS